MPIIEGEYVQRSEQDILTELENELISEFGANVDLTQSSVFSSLARVLAAVNKEEFEAEIQAVYESAFLDSAEGDSLDKVVELIGVTRQSAVPATGTVTLQHGGKVPQTYSYENGTVVSTGGTEPIDFKTTQFAQLNRYADWESGAIPTAFDGDTSDFTVQTSVTNEGTYALECSGTESTIVNEQQTTRVGDTIEYDTRLSTDTIVSNLFGVQDTQNFYGSVIDAANDMHKIQRVDNGTASDLESEAVTIPTDEFLINEVRWLPDDNGTIISKLYDSGGVISTVKVTGENQFIEGGFGYRSIDTTGKKYWDVTANTSVETNIRASEAGGDGNVGRGAISTMPSVPAGVNSLTNRNPTGDPQYYTTDLRLLNTGEDREADDELRERTRNSVGAAGNATVDAVIAQLREIQGIESVRVYENKTDSTVDGQPPTSFEAVVYGGTNDDIARAIHEVKGLTAQDVGGVRGTEVTGTVSAINGQEFTYAWSEPAEVNIDVDLTVVVNDQFIGKDALRDEIVRYIGGDLTDGSVSNGTGASEDIYIDQFEDVVTGPTDTGVIGIASASFTPSVTADGNGLDVISIADTEVATTNATDGSITITVNQQ